MFNSENFTYKAFIDYVMQKMKLDNIQEDVKTKIEKEITRILGTRILTSIANAMTEEEMIMFESIKKTNPELTGPEILYAIAEAIPAIHEIMFKAVNDLAEELIYDSERLDKVLEEKKQ
jgi:hypothetical protein